MFICLLKILSENVSGIKKSKIDSIGPKLRLFSRTLSIFSLSVLNKKREKKEFYIEIKILTFQDN